MSIRETFRQRQVASINIDWLLRMLKGNGVPLEEARNGLDLPQGSFTNNVGSLPFTLYNALFEWTAKRLDDQYLGIRVASDLDFSELGIFGYILLNSATLGDLFENAESYIGIFQSGAIMRLTVNGNESTFCYQAFTTEKDSQRQDTEFTLKMAMKALCMQLGQDWCPSAVYFEHAAPDDLSVHRQAFGSNLHFEHYYNGISFDSAVLSVPLNTADPQLLQLMKNQASKVRASYANKGDFIQHIILLLSASLGRIAVTSDQIANELNMTRSTLYRRLKTRGTSFQKLRDEVILKVAKQALAETETSITDIALQLGYAEISVFTRTFKRLSGYSPLQYRYNHSKHLYP